jgi:hypothetical protein
MSYTIGVDNSGVITSLLVKDHPEWMWYREAVQNALEATKSYISDKNIKLAEIKIRKLHLNGLIEDQSGFDKYKNKLSVLNLGGMTATELVKALKLGGSGKTASLNANYGVGIKTSVLNWSDLLIITYKEGKGHFAWLGKEYTNGIDFNIVAYSEDGQGYPILECTDWIKENANDRNYDLSQDFTEVIILGREVNQDTYLNTFGFGPDGEERKKVNAGHIKENLCKRYFRLPDNIKIKIDPSANNESGDKGATSTFITFPEAFEKAQQNPKRASVFGGEDPRLETVETVDGIKIHYFYDAPIGAGYERSDDPASNNFLNGPSWTTAFSGFVWRDEIYDTQVNTHRNWKTIAFRLGIQDKFSHFRIFVELPDRAVITDKYRVILQKETGELAFDSDENLRMIQANMPEWYKEKAKETKKEFKTDLDEVLRDMFSKYMDLDRPLLGKPSINQGIVSKRTQGQGNNRPAHSGNGVKRAVQKNFKNPQFTQPDIPQYREATDDEIKTYQIKDNFGWLIEKGGDNGRDLLIYNPNYKSIEKIATQAVSKLPDPELYFEVAKQMSKTEVLKNSLLWVMICRSRIAQEKMTFDEFGVSTSSDFLDTYIFARELQVSEDVSRSIVKQKKQDDKVIGTENVDFFDLENKFIAAGGKLPETI